MRRLLFLVTLKVLITSPLILCSQGFYVLEPAQKKKRGLAEHDEWNTGWCQQEFGPGKKLGTSKIVEAKCLKCKKILKSFGSAKLKKHREYVLYICE